MGLFSDDSEDLAHQMAKATATAKRNAALQKRTSLAANRAALRISKAERQASIASSKRIAAAQNRATAALAASSADPAPTQVIEDSEALMRAKVRRGGAGAAFGVSTARALSQFGLGGSPAYLG